MWHVPCFMPKFGSPVMFKSLFTNNLPHFAIFLSFIYHTKSANGLSRILRELRTPKQSTMCTS